MASGIYFFNGKDITANICMQLQQVAHVIMDRTGLDFPQAFSAFYCSDTCKIMQNTKNALWAESAEFIADRYFEEMEQKPKIS